MTTINSLRHWEADSKFLHHRAFANQYNIIICKTKVAAESVRANGNKDPNSPLLYEMAL
jgi:hypothetical protein